MIISTEPGALGSLTTRLRCGDFLLMVCTSKPSLFAGLDTSVAMMQYEKATVQESPCVARIAWAEKVSKAGRQQMHGALVAALSQAGDAQGVRETWQLGMLFSGCIASMQSKGLIGRYAHDLPTEPPSVADPHADYVAAEQYVSGPRFAEFTKGEADAVRRALASFRERLHPEIAEDTFGAFAAAALVTYAFDLLRTYPEEAQVFSHAATALEHASLLYPHPAIITYLADVFDAEGQTQAALKARKEASQQSAQWIAKNMDQTFLGLVRA